MDGQMGNIFDYQRTQRSNSLGTSGCLCKNGDTSTCLHCKIIMEGETVNAHTLQNISVNLGILQNETINAYTLQNSTVSSHILPKSSINSDILQNQTLNWLTAQNETVNSEILLNSTVKPHILQNETGNWHTLQNDTVTSNILQSITVASKNDTLYLNRQTLYTGNKTVLFNDDDDPIFYIKPTVDCILGALLLTLSLVVILLIHRIERKKKLYEVLLLSISLGDALFATGNIAVSVLSFLHEFELREVTNAIYMLSLLSSVLHLSWLAIDHAWIVLSPIRRNMCVTRRRTFIIANLLWAVTVLLPVSSLAYRQFIEHEARSYGITSPWCQLSSEMLSRVEQKVSAVAIICCSVLSICCYGYIVLSQHKKKESNEFESQVHWRVTSLCACASTVFSLATLPLCINIFFARCLVPWSHEMLVLNNVTHSIAYFLFRGWCDRRWLTYEEKVRKRSIMLSKSISLTLKSFYMDKMEKEIKRGNIIDIPIVKSYEKDDNYS